MKVIYAQEDLSQIEGKTIFLAGPTPRSVDVESWRPEALRLLEDQGFKGTVLVPEMRDSWCKDFEYGNQIDWESRALYESTVILFWIPRSLPSMPAFTTNIEFGIWLEKDPRKITLGWPEDAYKMNYIEYKAKEAFINCHNDLSNLTSYSIYKTNI